jgi:hypothetical protein
MVHNILPIVTQARPNIHLGREPQPDEGGITNVNDRFYGTFADIKFEDGDIKKSIRDFIEEVNNPVKGADKSSTLMDKYRTIIKKLDDEEKKQTKGLMVVGTSAFPAIHTEPEKIKPSFLDVGLGAGAGAGAGADADAGGVSQITPFINPPFYSPNLKRYPHYSTQRETSTNPLSKSDIRTSDYELQITGTPLRPFNPDEPISPYSQQPPSVTQKKPNSVLSPSRGPSKQLNFNKVEGDTADL